MPVKGNCDNCCCSKCAVKLPEDTAICCQCICDQICVYVTSLQEDCDCGEVVQIIPWDPDECAYVGRVNCDLLSIDVRFEVNRCDPDDDGTCHLCLTSACLGLDGECGTNSCRDFATGNVTGDCGDYVRDCEQTGGWDETWEVNASNCGDSDCGDITINAQCYPRINPAGRELERICKDCDCVCESVLMRYTEDACIFDAIVVRYDPETEQWMGTFGVSPPQTVTMSIERGADGCCYWLITITKGVFAINNLKEIRVKTECPDVDIELDIALGNLEFALLEIECAQCYEHRGCCEDTLIWTNASCLPVVPGTVLQAEVISDTTGCFEVGHTVTLDDSVSPGIWTTNSECFADPWGGLILSCRQRPGLPDDLTLNWWFEECGECPAKHPPSNPSSSAWEWTLGFSQCNPICMIYSYNIDEDYDGTPETGCDCNGIGGGTAEGVVVVKVTAV